MQVNGGPRGVHNGAVSLSVYGYLDYRSFLRDWFAEQKRARATFSHRGFVRKVGAHSPSLLQNVMAGRRRLSVDMAQRVALAMALDGPSTTFFLHLVRLDHCRTDEERARIWRTISAERRFRAARPVDAALLDVFARWHHLAIYELARTAGFRPDPVWIARALTPRVPTAVARQALVALERVGLLARRGGQLVPTDRSLSTPHEAEGVAAAEHHQAALERATEALWHTPDEQRSFHTVTAAVPESALPELRGAVEAFALELLERCDAHADPRERVVQCVIALYPLSSHVPETS